MGRTGGDTCVADVNHAWCLTVGLGHAKFVFHFLGKMALYAHEIEILARRLCGRLS